MSTSESKKQKSPVRYSARNVLVQIFTVCGWMQVRLEKCSAGTVCITLQPQWR